MNQNNVKEKNLRSYNLELLRISLFSLLKNPIGIIGICLYFGLGLFFFYCEATRDGNFLIRLLRPLQCSAVLLAFISGFVAFLLFRQKPLCFTSICNAFHNISFTNKEDTPPLPLRVEKKGELEIVELLSFGIPATVFRERQESIEAALNRRVTRIEEGKDLRHIILHLAPGNAKLPAKIYLPENPACPSSAIRLGKSLDGEVSVDLNKLPHLLVAGSSGSGKTCLVKSIIQQMLWSGADVRIIDLKGVDYPPTWQDNGCQFCTDEQAALNAVVSAANELDKRKKLFKDIVDTTNQTCSCLDDYNRLSSGEKLKRIVIVIDELAELTDTTGMSKADKERAGEIVANLSKIARLGRAFGINLVLGLQRPDASVLPGQISSNVTCRMSGRANAILSTIILGNGDADHKIPKHEQGLFLMHDGTLFRAYLPPLF